MTLLNVWNTVSRLTIVLGIIDDYNIDILVKLCQSIFGHFKLIENVCISHQIHGYTQCGVSNRDQFFDQIQRVFKESYFAQIICNVLYLLKTRENNSLSKLKEINLKWQWNPTYDRDTKNRYHGWCFSQVLNDQDIEAPIVAGCQKKSQLISNSCLKSVKFLRELCNRVLTEECGISVTLKIKISTKPKL